MCALKIRRKSDPFPLRSSGPLIKEVPKSGTPNPLLGRGCCFPRVLAIQFGCARVALQSTDFSSTSRASRKQENRAKKTTTHRLASNLFLHPITELVCVSPPRVSRGPISVSQVLDFPPRPIQQSIDAPCQSATVRCASRPRQDHLEPG